MPAPDDEQFETYLKQFRPIAPEALPLVVVPEHRRQDFWKWSAWVAVAAAVIALAVLITRNTSAPPVLQNAGKQENPIHLRAEAPLTIRHANRLLAEAPSFKSAVDDLAFRPQEAPLASNQQSAVYVLGREKVKL